MTTLLVVMTEASMRRDHEHLNLLAIFHYVLAGLTALSSSIPIVHVILGITILSGAMMPGGRPQPSFVALVFVFGGGTIILLGWTFAILLAFAGRSLQRRRRYMLCFVVACFACVWLPLGTALGVCTILVLSRDTVKTIFARGLIENGPEDNDDYSPPPPRPAAREHRPGYPDGIVRDL
jgi:hypothetical protein